MIINYTLDNKANYFVSCRLVGVFIFFRIFRIKNFFKQFLIIICHFLIKFLNIIRTYLHFVNAFKVVNFRALPLHDLPKSYPHPGCLVYPPFGQKSIVPIGLCCPNTMLVVCITSTNFASSSLSLSFGHLLEKNGLAGSNPKKKHSRVHYVHEKKKYMSTLFYRIYVK